MNNIENIEKLEFPYSIRKRPGVFGADLITPNLLFREVLDNTVDLVLKTRKPIKVVALTNKSNWNIVCDDGNGIPLYLDKDYSIDLDRPIIIDLLSKLNVGSNFTKTSYSLGMHGLGTKGANALSDYFNVYVNAKKQENSNLPKFIKKGIKENKPIFVIRFEKGILKSTEMLSLDEILIEEVKSGKLKHNNDIDKFLEQLDEDFGTLVAFHPDKDMHESLNVTYHGYPIKLIKSLFQYDKDLSGIDFKLALNNKEIDPFVFDKHFSDSFIQGKVFSQAVTVKTEEPLPIKFIYQVAWCVDKFNFDFDGSVNLLHTPNGKHLNLVINAIGQAFVKFNSLLKLNDAKLGLRLFALTLAIDPLFNSQDKTKLSKFEDKGFDEKKVLKALSDSFYKLMEENTDYFNLLCQRILEYKKATDKLSNIELLKSKIVLGDEGDRKRAMSGEMAKVYDCTSKDYKQNELYICEGISASGGLLKGRNKVNQAVLPLRGKLANTSNFDEERLVDNKEVLAIVNTIGCGLGGICDPSKSRYGKIIIATDQDSDGSFPAYTKIPLLNGTTVPISSLADKDEFWVYSCTKDGVIVPGRGHSARITKTVNKLWRITLDNGEVIDTSDNHPFMIRNGSYLRADELKVGDSLMPLYRKIDRNGYEVVKQNTDKSSWVHTHKMVISKKINGKFIKGYHTHHVDLNKLNNDPSNLSYLSREDHLREHGKLWNGSQEQKDMLKRKRNEGSYDNVHWGTTYNGTEKHLSDVKTAWAEGRYANSTFNANGYNGSAKNSETATKRNLKMWSSTDVYKDGMTYSEYMNKVAKENMNRPETRLYFSHKATEQWKDENMQYVMRFSRIVTIVLNSIETYGEFNEDRYNKLKFKNLDSFSKVLTKYSDGTLQSLINEVRTFIQNYPYKLKGRNTDKIYDFFNTYNHKVVSIEVIDLDEPMDLWDFSVDIWENFALSSGVFVHNSHIANLITTLFYQHAPEMIKQGLIYKLEAPYYKVESGKKIEYFYYDEKDKVDFSKTVTKLKGLGSYNLDEVKQFMTDPKNRRLIQLKWDSELEIQIEEASKLMYSSLARRNLMLETGVFVEGSIL